MEEGEEEKHAGDNGEADKRNFDNCIYEDVEEAETEEKVVVVKGRGNMCSS